MRYLNTRDVFIQNLKINIEDAQKINEVVATNEITFGGSLLGRFINSTIRKAKIGYNYYRVESIVKAIEAELNNIIFDGLTDEEKKEIKSILVVYYLKAIKDICEDPNLKETEKIKQISGDADRSLIPSCKKWIESLDDDDTVANKTKQELLDSLDKFDEGIKSLKNVSDVRNELVKDTETFIEDTIKLHDAFNAAPGITSSNLANLEVKPTSIDFGKVKLYKIVPFTIKCDNLQNQTIQITGSPVFTIS
jgi:hypothetical protein